MYKFVHNFESTPVYVRDDIPIPFFIPVSPIVQMNTNER